MDPDQLRTFLAVRKHLSYTRAAEELYVTQPAVSRRIRRLEKQIGVALFEQIGKSLHTTDAGETLAVEAERLLGSMDRATEAVRGNAAGGKGVLRIGASTTPGHYLVPHAFGRFHRTFPGVEIQYVVQNSTRIEQQILRNDLDIGFVGAHLTHGDLNLESIGGDEVVAFTHPDHPLVRRRRITAKTAAKELWVVREKGSGTRNLFESWLSNRSVRLSRTLELNCPEVIKATVAAGVGVSFLSLLCVRDDFRSGRLRRLPIEGLDLKRPLFAVRHSDKRVVAPMNSLLAEVKAVLASGPTSPADRPARRPRP